MKVLWHSEAPFLNRGYAVPTALFTRALKAAGHEVVISAFDGHAGATLHIGDMPLLPMGLDRYGNDVLGHYYQQVRPDVVILLHDIWVLHPDFLGEFPASAWTPVDQTPVPLVTVERLRRCEWQMTFSRFGERELRKAGFDPLYVPLAFDPAVYKPGDRAAARERMGIADDRLLVAFVGSNLGNPSRKSIDRIVKAWAKFVETHPTALLYMHTNPSGMDGGYDMEVMARFYGLKPENIRFAETYALLCGLYDAGYLATIYNAADVLLSPSRGEGFGLPVLDAQACGCPVVVSGFSSQPELCFGGYPIPIDPLDDMDWTAMGGEQATITPDKIVTALEWAYEQRGNAVLRAQAHEGAQAYTVSTVLERHLLPVLTLMAEGNRQKRAVEPPQTQEVAA